eukprot:2221452-Prorocentrum_lima.AAC.1
MTSSLVGSEMCIRDSQKGMKRAKSRMAMCGNFATENQALCDSTSTQNAVSYTHLTLPTICSV